MTDRIFFGLCAATAIGMILLALVWPQGLGARSPAPFGQAEAQAAPKEPSQVPIN